MTTRSSARSPPASRPSSGTATSSRYRPARWRSPAQDVSLQAARIGELAWAIQFHPEVSAADALHWIDDYETDADAVRIGVDPTALALETEAKIGAFNQLGRDLCGRWLDVAAARS